MIRWELLIWLAVLGLAVYASTLGGAPWWGFMVGIAGVVWALVCRWGS